MFDEKMFEMFVVVLS